MKFWPCFSIKAEASAYYADQVERWTYMSSMIAAAQGRGGVPTGYVVKIDGGYNKITSASIRETSAKPRD